MSISKLTKQTSEEDRKNKIIVIVGNVLNDERMISVEKMRVCALRFSEDARRRIQKAGGQCLTFDQLAKLSPLGENTILLRGAHKRETLKHFGPAPGTPGSHTKPYVLNANHRAKERLYRHNKN